LKRACSSENQLKNIELAKTLKMIERLQNRNCWNSLLISAIEELADILEPNQSILGDRYL